MKVRVNEGDATPWGVADFVRELATGIFWVQTPRHGGVWLAPERRKQLVDGFGRFFEVKELRRRAWFEEDCDASIPLFVFCDAIADEQGCGVAERERRRERHRAGLRNWNPGIWLALTGEPVPVSDSIELQAAEFEIATHDKFVVSSAVGDWHEECPHGHVLVSARRASTGEVRRFVIDESEYSERGRFGFVIEVIG